MVGRGRNQRDAGYAVTGTCNHFVNLESGQLAALTGLGPLRHLNLYFVGIDQVFGRDTKAS